MNQQKLIRVVLADSNGRFSASDTGISIVEIIATGYHKKRFTSIQSEYLMPNILINRSFNDHTISASYSRKIFKPFLGSLSPIINYMDSFNISYGNPYLDPAINNNYDLSYSWIKGKWLINANLFVYETLLSVESVALLKPGGIVARTFNGGWSLSTYLLLNGKRIDLQGTTTGTRYYNFWLNKTFANGKYGLNLRIDNLFMHYQTVTEISKTDSFTVVSDNKQIRRFFRFGFNYKFGKKEVRVPPSRVVTNEN